MGGRVRATAGRAAHRGPIDDPVVRRTKLLRPRLAPDVVDRPRLRAALDRGRGAPLVLLSGPAGFGKTTLLGQWLGDATGARPAAWVTLDDRDDMASFVAHLVAALQPVAPGAGRATLGLLRLPGDPRARRPSAPPWPRSWLAPAPAAGAVRGVVLDDFQEVRDPGVADLLDALLQHPPPALRLVLATRVDPRLPLARLRARGQLAELRAADLRFSPVEAATYLATALPAPPSPAGPGSPRASRAGPPACAWQRSRCPWAPPPPNGGRHRRPAPGAGAGVPAG